MSKDAVYAWVVISCACVFTKFVLPAGTAEGGNDDRAGALQERGSLNHSKGYSARLAGLVFPPLSGSKMWECSGQPWLDALSGGRALHSSDQQPRDIYVMRLRD